MYRCVRPVISKPATPERVSALLIFNASRKRTRGIYACDSSNSFHGFDGISGLKVMSYSAVLVVDDFFSKLLI
jgi:hypothetical protein